MEGTQWPEPEEEKKSTSKDIYLSQILQSNT